MSANFINHPDVLLKKPDTEPVQPKQRAEVPPKTSKDTDVYFWYLGKDRVGESAYGQAPRYVQSMPHARNADPEGVESVVNTIDGRKEVSTDDYSVASGKYRAVVKLFLLYEKQIKDGVSEGDVAWPIATGWLVSGDVVVTAGHCAYNYSQHLGRLIKVKVFVGYGSESVLEPRYGTAVATTDGWINKDGKEPNDVSFIKLDNPFTTDEVGNFYNISQTPLQDKDAILGVVGYPGDIVNAKGERGAKMYEMFKRTTYNLVTSDDNMLQYQIDTYGGNSGSPVINGKDSFDVIGVHVLGGYSHNSASVIDGPYGNRCHAYVLVASDLSDDKHVPKGAEKSDPEKPWLWKCLKYTTESDIDPVRDQLDESISYAKKVVIKTPNTIVDFDTPLSFGPIAGPRIAALTSAAITVAGRLAADSVNGSNVESLGQTRPYDGILGRAILAESALQHFLSLTPKSQEPYREAMGPLVAALRPLVTKIAPRILKGTLEPSMRLLLSAMAGDPATDDARDRRSDVAEADTGLGRTLSDEEQAFLNQLMEKVDSKAIESFYSTVNTIGDVIGSAFKKAGPVLLDVARIGLPLLLGTESGGLPPTALDPLAHRAILAEACLQSFVAIKDSKTREKVCEKIIAILKDLGPIMVRASPFMGKYVAPAVADILREYNARNKGEFLDFSYGR